MACPFGVRFFLGEDIDDQRPYSPRGKGTAEGCTLCVHRIDEGRLPACVEACPAGAMTFGDLNDPKSAIRDALARQPAARLRSDLALGQSVRYQGL
jgi:molybdopterin-containing oxidoreductase family iron-sulfur binding subunit